MPKRPTIQIFDNIVPEEIDRNRIAKAIWKCKDYQISTSDGNDWNSILLVGTFYNFEETQEILWKEVKKYCYGNSYKKVYINCHPANQPGSWHQDDREGYYTALYYPDMGDIWPYPVYEKQGGLQMEGYGTIQWRPNTLVVFPAHIKHRTLNHEAVGKMRFSVAFKLDNDG